MKCGVIVLDVIYNDNYSSGVIKIRINQDRKTKFRCNPIVPIYRKGNIEDDSGYNLTFKVGHVFMMDGIQDSAEFFINFYMKNHMKEIIKENKEFVNLVPHVVYNIDDVEDKIKMELLGFELMFEYHARDMLAEEIDFIASSGCSNNIKLYARYPIDLKEEEKPNAIRIKFNNKVNLVGVSSGANCVDPGIVIFPVNLKEKAIHALNVMRNELHNINNRVFYFTNNEVNYSEIIKELYQNLLSNHMDVDVVGFYSEISNNDIAYHILLKIPDTESTGFFILTNKFQFEYISA